MRCPLLLLTLASSVALTGAAPLGSRLAGRKDLDVVAPRESTGLSYAPLPELHVRSIEQPENREEYSPSTELHDKRDDDDDDEDGDHDDDHGSDSRLSPGTIAAVVVASVLGLLFLVFMLYWLVIRPRKKKAALRANNAPKDEEAAGANFTTVDLRGGRPDGVRDAGGGGSSTDKDQAVSPVSPGAIGVALSTPSSTRHNPSAPALSSSPSSVSPSSSPATPGPDTPRPAPNYQLIPTTADHAEAVAAIIATGAADDKSAPPRYYPSVVVSPPAPPPPPPPAPDPAPESRLPPTAPPAEDLTPLYDYNNHDHDHDHDYDYRRQDHNRRYFHMGQTPSSPPEYEQAISPLTPPGSPPPPGPYHRQQQQRLG